MRPALAAALLALIWLLPALASQAKSAEPAQLNGFVLEPATIPADQILRGGPARDGIPALDAPAVVSAEKAPWDDQEKVVGVVVGGEARAYPLSILVWHELVNDELGGQPILVSYCPLCGTALTFDRRLNGATRRFGVSGLLYQSDLLMFDRQSESLWSQIGAEAVAGPLLGQRLRLLRSKLERWGSWRRAHPDTTVLSMETGHRRPYDRTPYDGYASSRRLYFPAPQDGRYHPKMPTLGLRLRGGQARAYPKQELLRAGGRVEEIFAGAPVAVGYDEQSEVFAVDAPEQFEVVEGFWFAWMAFHPQSSVFIAAREK